MVERLFASRSLYRTLALFFDFPEEPINPRLISRYTGADIKSVHRNLERLLETGIIRGRAAGKFRYYSLDFEHPVCEELHFLFERTRGDREWEWGRPAKMPDSGCGRDDPG